MRSWTWTPCAGSGCRTRRLRRESVVRAGQWLMSADRAERTANQILQLVTEHDRERPLDRGLPVAVLA